MAFNSITFLFFFPVVAFLYYLLPHKYRWFHLLFSSCIFYMFFIPAYILVLFFLITTDYLAGIFIEKSAPKNRKSWLIISITANIGLLCLFKYYNFFAGTINHFIHFGRGPSLPLLSWALPIGLSFHTFQALSYTIEVYRGNQPAERHFGIYALYVMFFPQLVAGPIERPQNLLHQFYEKHELVYNNIAAGIRLMLWGFVKKIVIADRLSSFTDPVFNHPKAFSGTALAIATVFFSFQIYCDFSGYADIAIGAARVLGFRLMTNFNKPYHSRNITEFWKRWHISLSTWFRDYLYIPMGGNRVTAPKMYFNLLVVFLLSGFWHGANVTFIIWGAIHGVFLIFSKMTLKARSALIKQSGIANKYQLQNAVNVLTTFTLVTFAWIFFRANKIKDAVVIIGKLWHIPHEIAKVITTHNLSPLHLQGYYSILLYSTILIIFLEVCYIVHSKYKLATNFEFLPLLCRWSLYFAALFAIIFTGVTEQKQFIYFQF